MNILPHKKYSIDRSQMTQIRGGSTNNDNSNNQSNTNDDPAWGYTDFLNI